MEKQTHCMTSHACNWPHGCHCRCIHCAGEINLEKIKREVENGDWSHADIIALAERAQRYEAALREIVSIDNYDRRVGKPVRALQQISVVARKALEGDR